MFAHAVGAGILWALFASQAAAQTDTEQLRQEIRDLQLGAGYAQILNIASTPDVSSAYYDSGSEGDSPGSALEMLRLPFQFPLYTMANDTELLWRTALGFLNLDSDFALDVNSTSDGRIASEWSASSLSAGLLARIPVGGEFVLEPGLDIGVARLKNKATYLGTASILRPILDGLVFNWRTDASLITPGVALDWIRVTDGRRMRIRGHVAHSWIRSFNESDPLLEFSESASVYSIRVDYVVPTGMEVRGHTLDWVIYGGYAGFFGKNRDILDFNSVAELGTGVQTPVTFGSGRTREIRLGASMLYGSNISGWAVTLGLDF